MLVCVLDIGWNECVFVSKTVSDVRRQMELGALSKTYIYDYLKKYENGTRNCTNGRCESKMEDNIYKLANGKKNSESYDDSVGFTMSTINLVSQVDSAYEFCF